VVSTAVCPQIEVLGDASLVPQRRRKLGIQAEMFEILRLVPGGVHADEADAMGCRGVEPTLQFRLIGRCPLTGVALDEPRCGLSINISSGFFGS
jgi:hypothetical protein